MKVKDIMRKVEGFAPLGLAMSWDNVGLLLGDAQREVNKAVTCLDVDENAVNKAIEIGAELIVSHHPLIFRAINKITDPLLLKLIEHKIAVISLHTNLDVAPKSVNHVLAEALGLTVIEHLSQETGESWHRFSLTVPVDHLEPVREAIFAAGAGLIGLYDSCSQSHQVREPSGLWREVIPLSRAKAWHRWRSVSWSLWWMAAVWAQPLKPSRTHIHMRRPLFITIR